MRSAGPEGGPVLRCERSGPLVLLDGFDLERKLDLVANARHTVRHTEIGTLDVARSIRATAVVLPRVLTTLEQRDIQRDRTRDAQHRQVAGDGNRRITLELGASRLEGQRWEFPDVEEIRRS